MSTAAKIILKVVLISSKEAVGVGFRVVCEILHTSAAGDEVISGFCSDKCHPGHSDSPFEPALHLRTGGPL